MQNNILSHVFFITVAESEAVAVKEAALKTRLSSSDSVPFFFIFLLTFLASGEF